MTVLTQLAYRNFEISGLNVKTKIEIFVIMGPHGSEDFKTLLILQF